MAHVQERWEQVIALYPGKHAPLCEIRQKMHWHAPAAHVRDQSITGAPEIYAQIQVLDTGDEHEYANEIRRSLLMGDSWVHVQRQGVHFMFCASAVTAQLTSNYPAPFMDVHEGATSVISCIRSALGVYEIYEALIRGGVDWRRILRLAFFRQLPFDKDTGARTPLILEDGRILHDINDTCIIYWTLTDKAIQEPGDVGFEALQGICEVNAHGDTHGSHATLTLLEPGLELKRAENNVLVKIAMSKGGKPMFERGALVKKKLPGGDSNVGGITLKQYQPHEMHEVPNTPGSKASTPMRIPSAHTGNKPSGSPSS